MMVSAQLATTYYSVCGMAQSSIEAMSLHMFSLAMSAALLWQLPRAMALVRQGNPFCIRLSVLFVA